MPKNLNRKKKAVELRKNGESIRHIEKSLCVPRSTLNYWFKDIEISDIHKRILYRKWQLALIKARAKARLIKIANRQERIQKIRTEARDIIEETIINKPLYEIIFATFYIAEGAKTEGAIKIANSNPEVISSVLCLFRYLYSPEEKKIRCCLHLRIDQSEISLKKFWSKKLNIPVSQFTKTQFDKRTKKPSFKNYKGVCELYYGNTDLQRRVIAIGEEFFNSINKMGG
jgi:hypothetical protein